MIKFLKSIFAAPNLQKFTFEEYIKDKGVETPEQLEFWQREFAQRERIVQGYIAAGKKSMADWIRLQY